MLRDDGWFDWAVRDPGPPDRVLSNFRTPLTVYVCHSMEGVYHFPDGYTAMRDPRRFPTAWHWTKARTGTLYQHYPVWAHLQHGHSANILGPGGELEGFQNEPINNDQMRTDLRIIADINFYLERKGFKPLERDNRQLPQMTKRGLVEHREMTQAPNTTQCPSSRYAPLWAALEDDMSPEDKALLDKLVKVMGNAQMDEWLAKGNAPLLTAFASEQTARGEATNAINGHLENHPNGGGAAANHKHRMDIVITETGPVI